MVSISTVGSFALVIRMLLALESRSDEVAARWISKAIQVLQVQPQPTDHVLRYLRRPSPLLLRKATLPPQRPLAGPSNAQSRRRSRRARYMGRSEPYQELHHWRLPYPSRHRSRKRLGVHGSAMVRSSLDNAVSRVEEVLGGS